MGININDILKLLKNKLVQVYGTANKFIIKLSESETIMNFIIKPLCV